MRLAGLALASASLCGCVTTYYDLEPTSPNPTSFQKAIELGKQDAIHPDEVVVCLAAPVRMKPYQSTATQGADLPPIVKTVDSRVIQMISNPRVEAGRLCGKPVKTNNDLGVTDQADRCFAPEDLTAVFLTKPRKGVGDGPVDTIAKCPGER